MPEYTWTPFSPHAHNSPQWTYSYHDRPTHDWRGHNRRPPRGQREDNYYRDECWRERRGGSPWERGPRRRPEDPETSTQEAENTPIPSNNAPTVQEHRNETGTSGRKRGVRVGFPQEPFTQPPTHMSPPESTTNSPGPSQRISHSPLADHTPAGSPPTSQEDLERAADSGTDEEEGQNVYKIEKHKVTNRKSVDWSLNVTRPVLILGDSNVARIKQHAFPSLQIDSFPGANLLHAAELLSHTPNQPQVESVVLSFGINNRQQKQSETCIKQMQRLMREAKKAFPNANIKIATDSGADPHSVRHIRPRIKSAERTRGGFKPDPQSGRSLTSAEICV
uniref:Uncharacterized protein n=1 Tax=Knipowitschia caucasica TaxID=637954 RepID=A0AAV2LFG3_KNICA